jgi:GR25 family glycosyltransferase involved in LPS biosynthesis
MIDFFSRIVLLNLFRETKKYNRFMSLVTDLDLHKHIERFDAVDGKNLDIRTIGENFLSSSARSDILLGKQKRFGVSLTYGALGCALSHYLILKECSKANKPYLIFEDDIVLDPDFSNQLTILIEHVKNIALKFDIIYLGLHNIPSLNKKLSYDDMLYVPQGLTCGTWAMIISPEGASNILKLVFPLNVQIDSEISRHKNKLKVFATKKELAKHDHYFGSTTQSRKGCETAIGILNGHSKS